MRSFLLVFMVCFLSAPILIAGEGLSVDSIIKTIEKREFEYNLIKASDKLFYGANNGAMTHYSSISKRPAAMDVFYGALGHPSVRLRKSTFVIDDHLDLAAGIHSWKMLGNENPSIQNRSEYWQGQAISMGYDTVALRQKISKVNSSRALTEDESLLVSHWTDVFNQAALQQGVLIDSFADSSFEWNLKTDVPNATGVNSLATYMYDNYKVPLIISNISPQMAYYDYNTNEIRISELSLAVGKLHFGLFLLHEAVHAIVRNKENLSEEAANYKGYFMSGRLKASQLGSKIVIRSSRGYSDLMSFDEVLAHLIMTLVQVFTSDTKLFAIDGIELAVPLQKAGNLKKKFVDPFSDEESAKFIESFGDEIEIRTQKYAADFDDSIYVSLKEYHFRVPNQELALKLKAILSTSFKANKKVTLSDILSEDGSLAIAITKYVRGSIYDLHNGLNAALSELFYMKETQAKLLSGELKPAQAFKDIMSRIEKIKGAKEVLNEIPTQFFTGLFE